ncbi:MAG TPA: ABC transporter substrate-binding protein [Acetobacteraceae bacterium]|nr:ABC transporter substrate-binding protein [Acetobacteraceae bacterium]
MIRRRTLLLATPAIIAATGARAAAPVKIGVLFPLTGNSAASGQEGKQAVEIGAEIVNAGHPELKAMPIGTSPGLPNLGGAKIEPIYVDHRGDPSVAQSLAQRLITDNKVVALLGSYQSSTAMTATAVAERYGVPFVVGDSVAGNITGRGFKYTFRVTPIAQNFADSYMRFLKAMQQSGKPVSTIAIVNENTDYGSSVGDAIEAEAKKTGLPVAIRIPYSANGTDVSAQVLQLKAKNPSVALFVSYASDAILFMRTMQSLAYLPTMIIGDSAGFSDPSFLPAVGPISQGLMNRSVWSKGPPGSLSYDVNQIYQAKSGHEIDDVSGRTMQAFFVLADAINRAGAADPKMIQAALRATDWPRSAVFIGYRGVKFDATGQNVLSGTYLTQLQGKDYATVWPEAPGNAKLVWPMTGWKG